MSRVTFTTYMVHLANFAMIITSIFILRAMARIRQFPCHWIDWN